jgi:hypothetical protein
MEIVSIEKRTFEAMVARFNRFVSRMEVICQRHGEKRMSEWMDNQDVCRMLNISPRTLQTLRDTTVPKMWSASFLSLRIGERKQSSKVKQSDN